MLLGDAAQSKEETKLVRKLGKSNSIQHSKMICILQC